VIAGQGGLTKLGAGTLDLLGNLSLANGIATYTGNTVVSAGTLKTDTRQAGTASITVGDGATFHLRVANAGTALLTTSLTTGVTTGGKINFDLNAMGNPLVAPINTASLTTHGTTTLAVLGATTPGTFSLIDYDLDGSGPIGGSGFAGFTSQPAAPRLPAISSTTSSPARWT
jgi:autotransporter-associated beta strand protein